MSGYGRRRPQVRKGDLYMFTALWMQESPWAFQSTDDLNVVGSVFVLPNDRVLSADCTRINKDTDKPIHGAIRPLIKYPDKVEGCEVYLTRKPCAHCVKMLVQARVSKVFYLPLPPEKPNDEEENKSVDALFQVSEVSKSVYVPDISKKHIRELDSNKSPYGTNTTEYTYSFYEKVKTFREQQGWIEEFYLPVISPDNQQSHSQLQKDLGWQEYGDEKEIMIQVLKDMKRSFKWFYLTTFATGETDEMEWEQIDEKSREPEALSPSSLLPQSKSFDEKVATHLSRLAQMLSNRTDDPRTGVGCVITNEEEIVSIGWNGFPSKALYGNHPRGSAKDETKKKYPHIIYAAQNALLSRNQRNLDEKCVVYMNIIPGDDCMPLLYEVGVRNLVLPFFNEEPKSNSEKEKKCFYKLLRKITVLRAPKVKPTK